MSGTELALLSLATPLAVEASTVAYWIVYGLLALALAGVVIAPIADDRDPSKVLAWLFVLMVFPVVGLVGRSLAPVRTANSAFTEAAERRVLELLPTELTVNEIASRLWVSRETVPTHVKDIWRKLEAHSRSEAVTRTFDLGLLSAAQELPRTGSWIPGRFAAARRHLPDLERSAHRCAGVARITRLG